MKIQRRHQKQIKQFYTEGYSVEELHQMFNKVFSVWQLKQLTKDLKQVERV